MELSESNSADEADRVLGVAHHVGLLVMSNQIEHFGLHDLVAWPLYKSVCPFLFCLHKVTNNVTL